MDLSKGSASDVNAQLEPAATITGKVTDGAGNPQEAVCVYAYDGSARDGVEAAMDAVGMTFSN